MRTVDAGVRPPEEYTEGEVPPGGVRTTSALTRPTTCLTERVVGVMITGASFKKSLAKLPVVWYELRAFVIPDVVDRAYLFPVRTLSSETFA